MLQFFTQTSEPAVKEQRRSREVGRKVIIIIISAFVVAARPLPLLLLLLSPRMLLRNHNTITEIIVMTKLLQDPSTDR